MPKPDFDYRLTGVQLDEHGYYKLVDYGRQHPSVKHYPRDTFIGDPPVQRSEACVYLDGETCYAIVQRGEDNE